MDTVQSHLKDVAKRAAEYAKAFNSSEEAYLAGLLHDLGKYGSLFQERIKNPKVVHGIDHWSAGAWQALMEYKEKGVALALAIQGHHVGLQQASKDSLNSLNLEKLKDRHPMNLRLSEPDVKLLIQRMADDGLSMPPPADMPISLYEWGSGFIASGMLDVRMLFSTLVDADFIETEAHFHGPREDGPLLESQRALDVLEAHLKTLASKSIASPEVNNLRNDLLNACREAGSWKQGLFTLTAPTGAGKTLSMLAFALEHAKKHGLRRIVFVIPYLSIIEQTVNVYREVFPEKDFGKEYVLEDHSLAGTREEEEGKDTKSKDYDADQQRLLAQNWDAPIIVTTSVQSLESLFANRSSACRKLHRLAGSVILFDEVQTLPIPIAVPTLAALSRLAERYNTSVVFSTATQPAFTHLNEAVKKYCACGWEPKEIVPDKLNLFGRARRTKVKWPDLDQRTSWDELAEKLKAHEQVLCVVNLKRHALGLFDKLKMQGCDEDELFHLSTNMCPAHREVVLDEVRKHLIDRKPCRLISTQCVEAGVDVDFPVAFRAWGPLDSIAQAAGRCNRNGNMKQIGSVHLFIPPSEEGRIYPDINYEQAATVASILLKLYGVIDINDPKVFKEYYERLYDLKGLGEERDSKLITAIEDQDFVETAKNYKVIKKNALNVLVPYRSEIFDELLSQISNHGLEMSTKECRKWIKRARPYTIGLYKPKQGDPITCELLPIKANNQPLEDWFYINKSLDEEIYNPKTGLVLPATMKCWIA